MFILGARQRAVKSIPGCNKWGCSRTCIEAGCLSWARASVALNEDAVALATRRGVYLGRAPAYSEKYPRLQQMRMQSHLQRGGVSILGARQRTVKSIPGCNKWGCRRTCNEAGCFSWARASVQWKVFQVATNEDAVALATKRGVYLGRAPEYSEKYPRLQQIRMQSHLQRGAVFILGARQRTVKSIPGCNKWGCSRTCNEAGCWSWARASVQWTLSQVTTNEDVVALATRRGVYLGRAPAYSEKYPRLQQIRM